ncbi:RNA-directed DNA polymerase, eukaryota, reverse transcriptase zinc-binding domain protein [Tanacetum coccineum]
MEGVYRECLQSAHTSILVNGSPTSEFSIKRGLRQGDPLSLYLFILIIAGLYIAIKDAVQASLIRGVKVGLLININKSSVFGIGVSTEELEEMARITGCSSGLFPFAYLGLPIGGVWSFQWWREVTGRSSDLLARLMDNLNPITRLEGEDTFCWSIGSTGLFTVRATRNHIDDLMLLTMDIQTRWYKILPRKVNIFFWRLRLERLPHCLNLSRRGLDITSIMCPVCSNEVESNEHLFTIAKWLQTYGD